MAETNVLEQPATTKLATKAYELKMQVYSPVTIKEPEKAKDAEKEENPLIGEQSKPENLMGVLGKTLAEMRKLFEQEKAKQKKEEFQDKFMWTWYLMQERPLREWGPEALRREYEAWSDYEPAADTDEYAKIRSAVITLIIRAVEEKERHGEKGVRAAVLLGERPEASISVDYVKNERIKHPLSKHVINKEWYLSLSTEELRAYYNFWKKLQKEEHLSETYDAKGSLADRKVNLVLAELAEVFSDRGITNYDQKSSETLATTVPEPPKQQVIDPKVAEKAFWAKVTARLAELEAKTRTSQKRKEKTEDTKPTRRKEPRIDPQPRESHPTGKRDAEEELEAFWRQLDAKDAKLEKEDLERKREEQLAGPYKRNREKLAQKYEATGAFDDPERLAKLVDEEARKQGPDLDHRMARAGEYYVPTERDRTFDGAPDYYQVKVDLLTGARRNWEIYDWSRGERTTIHDVLMEYYTKRTQDAESIMAALILHGITGREAVLALANPDPNRQQSLVNYLTDLDILKDDKHVLEIMFQDTQKRQGYLDRQYHNDVPGSFEDTAWQMAYAPGANEVFKNGNTLALLRSVVKEVAAPGGKKQFKFGEIVNIDNIYQWAFERMSEEHGKHTKDALDFEELVKIEKGTFAVPINVYSMLDKREGAAFRSKYGEKKRFGWVANELEKLTVLLSQYRASGIIIQKIMRDPKALQEQRGKEYIDDIFTRLVGPESLFSAEHKIGEKGQGTSDSDGKIGAVENTIYMAYTNIINPSEMARVLGLGQGTSALANFFTLDRLREVRDELIASKEMEPGLESNEVALDLRLNDEIPIGDSADVKMNKIVLEDVFDANGIPRLGERPVPKMRHGQQVYDEKTGKPVWISEHEQIHNFVRLFNFFGHTKPNERFQQVVRRMIADKAAEIHGLTTSVNGEATPWSRNFAEMAAHGKMYFLQVANMMDIEFEGFNEEAKLNKGYKMKSVHNAATSGNHWLMSMMPRWLLPAAHVLLTNTRDKNGKRMTNHEVTDATLRKRAEMDQWLNQQADAYMKTADARTAVQRKVLDIIDVKSMQGKSRAEIEEKAKKEVRIIGRDRILKENPQGQELLREYRKKAEGHTYEERAMYNEYVDHYLKGWKMDEYIRGAKDLGFGKYISEDTAIGATLNFTEWQKDFGEFTTVFRKWVEATDIEYGTEIWDWDAKLKTMRLMAIGESAIGQQILNEFKKPDGTTDWKRINENKRELTKTLLADFVKCQMLQYRERAQWNLSQRYSYAMTDNILKALSRIPGDFVENEEDARYGYVSEYFFDGYMDYIKEGSGTTAFKMNSLNFLSSGFLGTPGKDDGFFSGLGAGAGIAGKAIFQGIGT